MLLFLGNSGRACCHVLKLIPKTQQSSRKAKGVFNVVWVGLSLFSGGLVGFRVRGSV